MIDINYKRVFARRFLSLPFRHQISIVGNLNITNNTDDFYELFRKANELGIVYKLWDEVEKYQSNPLKFNPFVNKSEHNDT